jgi:hypothetical protein
VACGCKIPKILCRTNKAENQAGRESALVFSQPQSPAAALPSTFKLPYKLRCRRQFGRDQHLQETAMQTTQVPARDIHDSGNVKLGGWRPSLPPTQTVPAAVKDAGKVHLGGWSPSLPAAKSAPVAVKDAGKVHLGGWSPSLPRKA